MQSNTPNKAYLAVVLTLFGALCVLYLLQHRQYTLYIARQNYIFEQKIDTLSRMVTNLESRLYWAEQSYNINQYHLPDQIIFCGDTLLTNDVIYREKIEREFYSLLSKPGQIQLYLKRSLRYIPMIETKLRQSGLPQDLKFLAIHESALLPTIRSRSNAVGLWQFMRGTARLYRLKINRYIDERQDPERSTEAAIRMLKDLYRQFGDWSLVMAAYNGGVNRIHRSIKQQNTSDFLALSLPEETERYYFKILATKLILDNPGAYGFIIDEDDYFFTPKIKPVEFTITANDLSLGDIAAITGLSLAYFKHLNPQFTNSVLPRGSYTLYIPETEYTLLAKNAEDEININFTDEAD
jgi:membrane-bound lytic murein transglycosylase D